MIHTLDLPWSRSEELKEKYQLKMMKGGLAVYSGPLLPAELRPYVSDDFSYSRWVEDERNATVLTPLAATERFTPTEEQHQGAETILATYENGIPGFLLADRRAGGKSLTSLMGVTFAARAAGMGGRNKGKLLIVTRKSHTAHWRRLLWSSTMTTSLLRPLVINYSQLNKLLMAPAQARLVKKASTKTRQTAKNGVPTVDWDFIIFDDAHLLQGYPRTANSQEAAAVAKLNAPYEKGRSPFVVFATATPGASPLDFTLMSRLFSPLLPHAQDVGPAHWAELLEAEGFAVVDTPKGYQWAPHSNTGKTSSNPAAVAKYQEGLKAATLARRKDARRLARLITGEKSPFLTRNLCPGRTDLLPLPLEMKGGQRFSYQEAWRELQKWLNLHPAGDKDTATQVNNYVRRTSYLKHEALIDFILEEVSMGRRVYVRCPVAESAQGLQEKLVTKAPGVALVTEKNPTEHLAEWDRFQSREAMVLLATGLPQLGQLFTTLEELPTTVLTVAPQNHSTFQQELATMAPRHEKFIYVAYFDRTLEADLLRLTLENKVYTFEKMLRGAAARTTPPNRLS